MNEIFIALGIESWKPALTALLLPPVPLLLLVLVGARLMFRRRLTAWALILLAVLGLWFSSTTVLERGLTLWLLQPPPPLSESQLGDLKKAPRTVIVVLGGGRRERAPEYGISTLHPRTVERLRYGVWLSRETGLPLAFSGGVGHGAEPGPTEAEIASRVAEREFGRAIRFSESASRDTRENAFNTVRLLQPQGVEQIVLVTQSFHMPRALRNFQRAAEGSKMRIVAAPMDVMPMGRLKASDWVPSSEGFEGVRLALREWLGRIAGA